MIYLSPRNNYLLVEQLDVKVQEQKHAFVLPTDYKEKEKPYKVVRVIEDSTDNYFAETLVLVPTHMLEEVELDGVKHYLITQNHVIAVVQEE